MVINMENKGFNVIRKTEEEWLKIKKRLGFSVDGATPEVLVIPESLESKIREFFMELIEAQALLEVFEGNRIDGSVLEKWRHGLFEQQYSIARKTEFVLKAKNIERQKLRLISAITETFLECFVKIGNLLLFLKEGGYENTNEYKKLQELFIVLRKFVLDSKKSTPQSIEQIISEFKKELSEFI
jgi:hypothetical protein